MENMSMCSSCQGYFEHLDIHRAAEGTTIVPTAIPIPAVKGDSYTAVYKTDI